MEQQTSKGDKPYIEIWAPEEFRFPMNLAYLARSANECMYQIEGEKVYKAISFGNEVVRIEVSCEHTNRIQIRFLEKSGLPREDLRDAAVRYVRDWFDLDTDLVPFYQLGERHPLLRDLIHRFYGLRMMGIPDLFEALCWGIMGQQINLTFAYTLKRRFVETFGRSIEGEGRVLWLFPDPEVIAGLSVEQLTPLQLTRSKSEYLIEVATRMADGRLSKEALISKGDFRLAEKDLTAIRGIGPWTANYVRMRCLRDPSAFPIADVGLHQAVRHLLELDRKPTLDELNLLFAEWKDWAGYITFYMWRTLY
jgi:DNA-3-methyladenine glycosylase II